MDYDELERWTWVGFERGMRLRKGRTVGVKIPDRLSLRPTQYHLVSLPSSLELSGGAARGQLDLRRAQDAHDRGNSRGKLRRIGDGRLWWPLDQYRGGTVGPLDEFDLKSIGLGDRTHG
jgi:hypothetical protein